MDFLQQTAEPEALVEPAHRQVLRSVAVGIAAVVDIAVVVLVLHNLLQTLPNQ